MAMIVRGEHDLPTLRIASGRGDRDSVRFSTARGRGEEVDVDSCGSAELGPIDRIARGEPAPDGGFGIPRSLLERIGSAVDAMGPSPTPPHTGLWLEFPSPRGNLYVLPWESMLSPLERPVIRLPSSTVRPQSPASVLEVALCASSPWGKTGFDTSRELTRLAGVWSRHPAHEVHLHLFTDAGAAPELRRAVADLGPRVVVHEPPPHSDAGSGWGSGGSPVAANPWLQWMCDSMRGQALDVVHLVSHGYLAGGRGAVALASSPTTGPDEMYSRFVGATELSAFLSQQGAWSLLLTGPPGNASPTALRELADTVAASHAGVTVAHELTADEGVGQLAGLLALVYGGGTAAPGAMPGVTCWVHPKFVEYPQDEQDALLLTPDGNSSLIKEATHEALANDHTPNWVASGTRYLETLQTQWMPESAAGDVDPDAVAALRSVSDLLERHARRHLDDVASGSADPAAVDAPAAPDAPDAPEAAGRPPGSASEGSPS